MTFTHLVLEDVSSSTQKTKRWAVLSKYDNSSLGVIAWFARWRKYAFHPQPETVFEEVCMRELSQFIVNETMLHKEKQKRRAAQLKELVGSFIIEEPEQLNRAIDSLTDEEFDACCNKIVDNYKQTNEKSNAKAPNAAGRD